MALLPLFKEPGVSGDNSGANYLYATLGFVVAEQLFEFYLSYRQRKQLKKDQPPDQLIQEAKKVDEKMQKGKREEKTDAENADSNTDEPGFVATIKQKFTKGRDYNLHRNTFSFISSGVSTLLTVTGLCLGFAPYFWTLASNVSQNEYIVSAVFLVATSLIETIISLPLSYYSTFVLEEKHGFNKTTQYTFWTDLVKNILIGNAISVPVMLVIAKLVAWGGQFFYLYVWGFILVFSLLMLTIYPTYIMPLFNEYKPLEDGSLKDNVYALAKSLEFPLTKLYEVDGSKRSSHSNAYLFGFFKDKRIVLFDTLFKNVESNKEKGSLDLTCTDEEVVGILAHELGHWKMNHTVKGFVLQQFIVLVTLAGFSFFVHDAKLYGDFGFSSQPVVIGLSLFSSILSPFGTMLGLAMNTLTRKYEFEADAFATTLGKAEELKTGLLKISISNLSSFHVDWLFHAMTHSHPTLLARLQAIDNAVKKTI